MASGPGKNGFLEAALVTLLLVGALLFATWQIATRHVPPGMDRLQSEIDFLGGEVESLKNRADSLRARNTVLEREVAVLRDANEMLREAESERNAQLARQQSELDFFRRLAGAGGAQTGLDIYHVELAATGSPGVWRFTLTLTQNIRRAAIVDGQVRIEIEGTDGDRPLRLDWSGIGGEKAPGPAFRFKYFQQLDGYLTLPDGFLPDRLLLTLEAEGDQDPVERQYEWSEIAGVEPPAGSS
jgi:hypothetical protein